MLMLASLVLGFPMLDALSGFVVAWLHPTPMRPCLDVTIRDASPWCPLLHAYLSPFSLHAMTLLTMLVCATGWLSMHLYMLVYMLVHESWLLVCRPYFSIMMLWTPDPNLHLSLMDNPLLFAILLVYLLLVCLLSCLFASSLVCSHPCFYVCHVYHAYLLYALSYALCTFSFHYLC